MSIRDLTHPDDREQEEEHLNALLNGETIYWTSENGASVKPANRDGCMSPEPFNWMKMANPIEPLRRFRIFISARFMNF